MYVLHIAYTVVWVRKRKGILKLPFYIWSMILYKAECGFCLSAFSKYFLSTVYCTLSICTGLRAGKIVREKSLIDEPNV